MQDAHETAARRLRDAYSSGAVPPLRDLLEPVDIEGAYAVQAINTRFWVSQGRRIVGRKAGLTAKAVQTQLTVRFSDLARETVLEKVWSAAVRSWRIKRGCVNAFFQAASLLVYSRNSLAV